jgi:hypothetical protein
MTMAPYRIISTTIVILALSVIPMGGQAQPKDHSPRRLAQLRLALYVKAHQAPLVQLGEELDQLVLLSETCRAQYGTKACGLAGNPRRAGGVEEIYAYYVRTPAELSLDRLEIVVQRENWAWGTAGKSMKSGGTR